jgi:hypothetical protein
MNAGIEQLSQYVYNPKSRRYKIRATGRYISAKQVRGAVDSVIDAQTSKIRTIAQSLVEGRISLATFQIMTGATVKETHVMMAAAAAGGINGLSASDLGYIGNLVKAQYTYLRGMTKDIYSGSQALDGSLVARVALYTQAARGSYEEMSRREASQAGITEERRILGPADHCQDCVSQARKGWQPAGVLNPIGDSQCMANCHCTFDFR